MTFFRMGLACLAVFMLAACAAPDAGNPVQATSRGGALWDVKPHYFCPGDQLSVSWDFTSIPKNVENCKPANGGYAALKTCSKKKGCPKNGVCAGGYCCRRDVHNTNPRMCPAADGCYPGSSISINLDTVPITPLMPPVMCENRDLTGSRSLAPVETTVFKAFGFYAKPFTVFDDTKRATMISGEGGSLAPLTFPYQCKGKISSWDSIDLSRHPFASARASITRVRNVTRHIVTVTATDPPRGPVTLRPGQATDALNGLAYGRWSIALDAEDPDAAVQHDCDRGRNEAILPPLQLQVTLVCGK